VAPQLSGDWQHSYTTKTRQAGLANEQSINSLVSMDSTQNKILDWQKTSQDKKENSAA
jgi:hypothetical protein